MSNPIKERLDAMSLRLLDEAHEHDVKLDQRIDVFKAIVQYYLGTTRTNAKGKAAGDDVDLPNFKNILNKVQGKTKDMQ